MKTSEILNQELKKLSGSERSHILKGLEWTVNNDTDAVLIGGMAVAYHSITERPLTPDVDFLTPNCVEHLDYFLDHDYKYLPLMADIGFYVFGFNLDFIDADIGFVKLNEVILQNPILGIIDGREVKIASPELLCIQKLVLSRGKDLTDVFLLLESGKMDKELFKSYLTELELPDLEEYTRLIK